jgi:nitrogen-specific signal transduction histidine kinase/iron only hydrogenase large subunit-like protein
MLARPLITTIRERCRVCYGCVRECPAKAIRITGGQAEVMADRCIGCGNCVQVCSQHAKQVRDSLGEIEPLLDAGTPVSIMVAPSFPAEFLDVPWKRFVGMLRAAGFTFVHEVAFGADLVSERYRQLLDGAAGRTYVATTCPALVEYVERYHPHLVGSLAPIVSPMVAAARVMRRIHGAEVPTVFAGPCIAKKAETDGFARDEVVAAMTFAELRELFRRRGVRAEDVVDSDFDPPHGAVGGLFAITGGLLKAAAVDDDLVDAEGVTADGHERFVEAVKEFEAGAIPAALLEVLACQGCVMGPGMTTRAPRFTRQTAVSHYVKDRAVTLDEKVWRKAMRRYAGLDLSRGFAPDDRRLQGPTREEIQAILSRMGKDRPEDELNCGACGYPTCCEHAIAIHQGLAESEMCLPWTIDRLRTTVGELHESHRQLASTQDALVHAEKLASMGQLAAGIAHEVNNPLGVVLMYAHLLADEAGKDTQLHTDLKLIAEQADRCKRIVSGLLNFARQSQVNLQPVNVRDLVDAAMRGVRRPEGVKVRVEHASIDPVAELDRDQILQVLTNVMVNAIEAMPNGGTLTVRTGGTDERMVFEVVDTGTGIRPDHMGKIFTPFFTTKPMGRGTGLGLAVSYGIVKMHRGEITPTSNADPAAGPTGTTFKIDLPRRGRAE